MKKILFLWIIILLLPIVLATSPGAMLAAEELTDTIIIEPEVNAGITPDMKILYILDVWLDETTIQMAKGNAEKARLKIMIAEERLAEAKKMIQKNKTLERDTALEKERKEIADIEELTDDMEEQEKISIQEKLQKHIAVLERVKAQVPGEASKGINNAIINAQNVFNRNQIKISVETRESVETIRTKINEGKITIAEKIEGGR